MKTEVLWKRRRCCGYHLPADGKRRDLRRLSGRKDARVPVCRQGNLAESRPGNGDRRERVGAPGRKVVRPDRDHSEGVRDRRPFSGMMRHARPIYDRDLFASERKIVQDIAGKYNAVFIGRAAFHMLRDHRGFSCLRLCPSGIPDRPYHEGTEDFHVPGGVVHPGIGQETGEVYS